jgi:beta-barrel assembly-enhancing protease
MLKKPKSVGRRALLCLLLAGWLPLWQSSAAWALSLSEEKTLGRKIVERIRDQLPLVEEGEALAYVQSVANRVARQFEGSPYQFQLFLINESTPNAFAIPGGFIFMYRGLISMMHSEGELASIICHEMAHVQARHIAHRIEQGRILNIATIAGVLAAVFLGGGGNASSALAMGTMAGAQTLQLKYSRENEEEADRLGFYYLCAAGYDPQDMVSIMRNISRARFNPDSRIPSYLSSHPLLGERVGYLQLVANKQKAQAANVAPLKSQGDFPFLQAALLSDYEDPQVALEALHAMERQKDQAAAAAYGLGRLHLRQGQVEQALEKLREAAAQKSNSPMIVSTIGSAYFQQGRLPEAKKALSTALLLDPAAASIHFRLAMVLRDLGQADEALKHLHQAEQLSPMMPEIDYQLGVLLGQTKDYGLAHYYLGSYYRRQKDVKLAIFHFEKAKGLLAGSPAKVVEIEEELKELQGEKQRQLREKADAERRRRTLPP